MMLAIGYTVVMSWIFKYTFMSLSGSLYAMGQDMSQIGPAFDAAAPGTDTIGEAVGMMLKGGIFGVGNSMWLIIGLVVAMVIMAMGVANGIEKANKIMMPVLFGLFVILAVYIGFQPGASEGYKFLFTLDPKGLVSPQVWIYAFGQAFFSLSVAGNGSVIYGSYLPKDEDIPSSARRVALFDTMAALLAAFVIIPAIGASGFAMADVNPGPGLMTPTTSTICTTPTRLWPLASRRKRSLSSCSASDPAIYLVMLQIITTFVERAANPTPLHLRPII